MRVLHVVSGRTTRGAEVFAEDLARALGTLGVEQEIHVLHGRPGDSRRPRQRADGHASPGAIAWRLRSVVRCSAPDVIQLHGGEALKYAVAVRSQRVAPLVYRRIGMAPRWIRSGIRRTAYGRLMAEPAMIVGVADVVSREAVDVFGVAPRRVVTIPNGVDPTRLAPTRSRQQTRNLLGIPGHGPVLLSVGALTWEKDPMAHLDVGEAVMSRRPDAFHLFVGGGPLEGALRGRAARSAFADRLLILGARTDVGDLLRAADVALFVSRHDGMEGMPATVIEAGLAGVPVVANAIAGVGDVVLDGATGVLVPHGHTAELAEACISLLVSDADRRTMGEAARAHCLEHFEIERIAIRYEQIYAEVRAS